MFLVLSLILCYIINDYVLLLFKKEEKLLPNNIFVAIRARANVGSTFLLSKLENFVIKVNLLKFKKWA